MRNYLNHLWRKSKLNIRKANKFIRAWKYVVGYEGLYEISTDGKVRSLDRYVNAKKRWSKVY